MRSSTPIAAALAAALLLPSGCAFERGESTVEDPAADAGATDTGPPHDGASVPPSDSGPTDGAGSDASTSPDVTSTDDGGGTTEPVEDPPGFAVDIHPLLMDECGGCHDGGGPGAMTLSGDADADYDAMVLLLDLDSPADSPLLLEAVGAVSHGGGSVLSPTSADYDLILEWIAAGAPE